MVSPEHETVNVFAEWCDGPRSGLAAFRGRPHLYQSLWRDDESDPADDWALVPAGPAAAAGLLDRLRPSAHDAGAPTLYPGLGNRECEAFHTAWREFKAAVLASDGEAVCGVGDMRPLADRPPLDDGFDPLEVRWVVRGMVSVASVRERLAESERGRAAWRPADAQSAGEGLPL